MCAQQYLKVLTAIMASSVQQDIKHKASGMTGGKEACNLLGITAALRLILPR